MNEYKKINEYISYSANPSIDAVEKAIKANRERLKEIEQLYYMKRGMKIQSQPSKENSNIFKYIFG